MNSLRKIFNHKTSVSSPVAPTDTIKNKKKPPRLFRRTNTTKSLDTDLKSQTRRTSSWSRKSPSEHTLLSSKYNTQLGEPNLKTSRSVGALLENNNNNNNNNNIYSRSPNQVSFQSNSSSTLSPSLSSSTSQIPTTNSKMRNVEPLNTVNANSAGQDDSLVPDTPITQRQNEADEYIQQAIQFHESNQLEKATHYFKLAADKQSPLGMFLFGIALRHGWGCKVNPELAVKYLQKAAESAVHDLHASMAANPSIARHELVLAIYELGVSFRHGWGVPKNKSTAAYYFEIAANLGDPDAQNDLGACYFQGEGVKKDLKKAAKYYRMANVQGAGIMGNSWIFKKKYDD